ncbi:MAG: ribosomal protein S18-alanine N-acetyltransferase [Clostridiaceae bacterium]|jgi:ribosomal-protein-alanine N-acetyltransferase|nr:ribosomal protein S18-alanine N-acetyltransferase [Clostridiaceae bacterium]
MENKIIIRSMDSQDIFSVLEVEKRSFTIPWSEEMFRIELQNPNCLYFVAEISNVIVGYVGLWIIVDEGHISSIAVDPSYRRLKIGRALMQNIFDIAQKKQLKGLTLEVRASNIGAIELYKSFGFKTEGRRKAYYSDNQEDALIMWHHL